MGTSRATVPTPDVATAPVGGGQPQIQGQGQGQAQTQAQSQAQSQAGPHLPPLPEGVTQEAIDAAIHHVEQTGKTDGISPQILAAACQQIEAHAVAQGVDLNQPAEPGQTGQPGPANYVEAAVMDKQGTFDNFHKQRDSLQSAVTEQREAAQRTYQDALAKTGGSAADQASEDAMKALAAELNALDPRTIALINAMGVLSNTPGVMKSIIWMEIIRTMRNLISTEAKHQVEACMKGDAAA